MPEFDGDFLWCFRVEDRKSLVRTASEHEFPGGFAPDIKGNIEKGWGEKGNVLEN